MISTLPWYHVCFSYIQDVRVNLKNVHTFLKALLVSCSFAVSLLVLPMARNISHSRVLYSVPSNIFCFTLIIWVISAERISHLLCLVKVLLYSEGPEMVYCPR